MGQDEIGHKYVPGSPPVFDLHSSDPQQQFQEDPDQPNRPPDDDLPTMFGLAPLAAFFFASAVVAVPAPIDIGITFGSGSNNMPILNLPYASYKAYSYDVTDDVSPPS